MTRIVYVCGSYGSQTLHAASAELHGVGGVGVSVRVEVTHARRVLCFPLDKDVAFERLLGDNVQREDVFVTLDFRHACTHTTTLVFASFRIFTIISSQSSVHSRSTIGQSSGEPRAPLDVRMSLTDYSIPDGRVNEGNADGQDGDDLQEDRERFRWQEFGLQDRWGHCEFVIPQGCRINTTSERSAMNARALLIHLRYVHMLPYVR